MRAPNRSGPDARSGVVSGVAAYALWGAFPLYFHALEPASSLEVLAHRIVWSLAIVAAILWRSGDLSWARALVRDRFLLSRTTAAALLIATNWIVYIWAVSQDRVVEAALGYFINPLVTVSLGVAILGERLRRAQWAALGLGAIAVAVLTVAYGRVPWVALVLALSFAGYSFLKKQIPLTAPQSLAAETAVLAPIAVVVLAVLIGNGTARIVEAGWWDSVLLVAAGPVTAIPLMLFADAARRIPLTLLGLLQYLTPTCQFLLGVLVFHEHLSPARWAGFTLVWAALVVLSVDLVQRLRQREPAAALSG
jgi:chloramphenicol-sensitive protein RarD